MRNYEKAVLGNALVAETMHFKNENKWKHNQQPRSVKRTELEKQVNECVVNVLSSTVSKHRFMCAHKSAKNQVSINERNNSLLTLLR